MTRRPDGFRLRLCGPSNTWAFVSGSEPLDVLLEFVRRAPDLEAEFRIQVIATQQDLSVDDAEALEAGEVDLSQ